MEDIGTIKRTILYFNCMLKRTIAQKKKFCAVNIRKTSNFAALF